MKSVFILAGIAAVIFIFGTSFSNNLVAKHESIISSWAQVENQMERRFELIPNLVNTVKGYAEHEKSLLEEITNIRSQWAKANSTEEKVKVADSLDLALSRLIMVTENYPNLKADHVFSKLMDELAGTENRIAVERMRYNDVVRGYNVAIKSFPGVLIARMLQYSPATTYFQAEGKAKTVPEVKF
jgi:LemA protein